MTNTDPVPRRTREVAHLRAQAVKLRRESVQPPCAEVAEQALAACDSLLQDLANAGLFDAMPVACLVTDGFGSILNANRGRGVPECERQAPAGPTAAGVFRELSGIRCSDAAPCPSHWRPSSDAVDATQRGANRRTSISS
jgi:hypothetical protein